MGLRKLSLPLLILVISYPLAADEDFHYECRMGDSARIIAVYYDAVTKDVPCEVHYIKGGSDQLLWQARTQAGYCEAKAIEFVDQQGGKGWQCQRRSGAPK